MIRYIVLLACSLIISCDSETVIARYENGSPRIIQSKIDRSTQKRTYFYQNGEKKETGVVQDDKRNGVWQGFYPDGKLKHETRFKNGIEFSDYTYYYPNGTIEEIGVYNEGGNLEGKWTSFYKNDSIKSIGEFQNGQKVGLWILFDSSGMKLMEEEFYYNSCGKSIIKYKNGKKHGKWESWFLCDKSQSIGYYKNGLRDSLWTNYWEFGDSSSVGKYQAGKKIGKWKYWHESGNIQSIVNHKDSNEFLLEFWDEEGKKLVKSGNGKIETHLSAKEKRIEIYKEGVLIESQIIKIK